MSNDARTRFVEAMRDLARVTSDMDMGRATVEAAIEAFADAECLASQHHWVGTPSDGVIRDCLTCRAALLKEVFGE